MPNVAKILREEIVRISRKEAKAASTPLQRRIIKLERTAAMLKKQVALLEKVGKQLQDRSSRLEAAQPVPIPDAEKSHAWISGKGVKSLRTRLGLSQAEFAKLTGVSVQGVQNWEKKSGMLKFRDSIR